MAKKTVTKKHDCTSVELTRAANGWVVTPSYQGIYDTKGLIRVAASNDEALDFAKAFMDNPHVVQTEEYVYD